MDAQLGEYSYSSIEADNLEIREDVLKYVGPRIVSCRGWTTKEVP